MKRKGIVASLSRKRSFVFIKPEKDDGDHVFCHRSEFPEDSRIFAGLAVEYELRKDDRGQACNVSPVGLNRV